MKVADEAGCDLLNAWIGFGSRRGDDLVSEMGIELVLFTLVGAIGHAIGRHGNGQS